MKFEIEIPNDLDKTLAEDMIRIFNELLIEKILLKNKKYGNSLYAPLCIFNNNDNPEDLILIRVDDKLNRLQQMTRDDPKYWSEVKEIVAYLLNLVNVREKREAKSSS